MISAADCNHVALSYDYDWEADPRYVQLVAYGNFDESMSPLHIEFAKAVHFRGDEKYRLAWKDFYPDATLNDSMPKLLWDQGVGPLVKYMGSVCRNLETDKRIIPQTVNAMANFLPEHPFADDLAYSLLVEGMQPATVALAKALAWTNTEKTAVNQALPDTKGDKIAVALELRRFHAQNRAMALLSYLKTLKSLQMALNTDPPTSLAEMEDSLMKSFPGQDIDNQIKILRALKSMKGPDELSETGLPAGVEPEDLDTWAKLP